MSKLNYQRVFDYEELLFILKNNTKLGSNTCLIIESNIVHNVGIPILARLLQTYKPPLPKVVFNCEDILSYIILAIEYKLPYLLVNIQDSHILHSIVDLGKKYNTIIFNSIEKAVVYFNN